MLVSCLLNSRREGTQAPPSLGNLLRGERVRVGKLESQQVSHSRMPSSLLLNYMDRLGSALLDTLCIYQTCKQQKMLSALDKICPNFLIYYLRMCSVYLAKRFGRKEKSYDGINELEEEQFSITALPHDHIKSHEDLHDSPAASLHTFVYPIDPPQQHSEPQQQQQSNKKIGKFRINLEPYDKYYEIIEEKTRDIQEVFSQHQTVIQLDLGNNRTNFTAYQIPQVNGFKFVLTYQLPCSYAFYHSTNHDIKTVSLFSRNIESFQLLETVQPNLSLFGLSFKKILGLGLEPRRFNYLKYVNTAGENEHWEVAISLNTGQTYCSNTSSTVKEADIFSATHIREDHEGKSTTITIQTYMEVDLRSIIRAPKIVAKGLREVGFYLQNFYQHALNNYHQEMA